MKVVPAYLSNGITINEPDPLHTMAVGRYPQCMLDVSVTGKGKRKMDDVAVHAGSGSYTMASCASARLLGNQLTPDVVSVSSVTAIINADTVESDVPSNSLLTITAQDAQFSYHVNDLIVFQPLWHEYE